MNKTNRKRSNRSNGALRRKGSAPLELTLALPILMVLLSIIFGICTVTETRMMTTTAARNNAFEKRHKPWEHDATTLELANVSKVEKILGQSPIMPATGGLVSGKAANVPTGLFGPLRKLTLATQSERFVLGGGWDHQEINFEKHSALTLTDKAKFFGLGASDFIAFKKLGGFSTGSGGGGGMIGQLQNQIQHTLQEARQEIETRLAEIPREMKPLASDLAKKEENLKRVESNPNATKKAKDGAKSEVENAQSKVDELEKEKLNLRKAKSKMGVDAKLPGSEFFSSSEEELE